MSISRTVMNEPSGRNVVDHACTIPPSSCTPGCFRSVECKMRLPISRGRVLMTMVATMSIAISKIPNHAIANASFVSPSTSPMPYAATFVKLDKKKNKHNRAAVFGLSQASDSQKSESSTTSSTLTDWVVENLETDNQVITSSSATKAGENDTIPENGLIIGPFRILAADSSYNPNNNNVDNDGDDKIPIRLLLGRNGWGTGVHPTTRLCLEFLSHPNVIRGDCGEVVLDYGCGSGILSIAALHMGASKCIGVDVEAEALVTAERNIRYNGFVDDDDDDIERRFAGLHTREVLPYDLCRGSGGVDVCVANILIGQLVRPSMVAAITSNIKPGGLLCMSGIRPKEVQALKDAYDGYIEEWLDDGYYAELSATDTIGSIESYGFDCGTWARVVGRRKASSGKDDIEAMSELAVS